MPTRSRELFAELGRLDAVINVAGITRPTSFARGTEDDWRERRSPCTSTATSTSSPPRCPIMAAAGHGRILGVTSGSGWRPADTGAYGCAKRAVAALTWQLGRHAPPGVVVNAMSPIAVTRMVTAALARVPAARPVARRRRAASRSARCRSPRSSGPFGAHLVGDDLSWCSGQVLFAGGSEVAVIEQPRLLEVVRTAGVASLARVLDAVVAGVARRPRPAGRATGGEQPAVRRDLRRGRAALARRRGRGPLVCDRRHRPSRGRTRPRRRASSRSGRHLPRSDRQRRHRLRGRRRALARGVALRSTRVVVAIGRRPAAADGERLGADPRRARRHRRRASTPTPRGPGPWPTAPPPPSIRSGSSASPMRHHRGRPQPGAGVGPARAPARGATDDRVAAFAVERRERGRATTGAAPGRPPGGEPRRPGALRRRARRRSRVARAAQPPAPRGELHPRLVRRSRTGSTTRCAASAARRRDDQPVRLASSTPTCTCGIPPAPTGTRTSPVRWRSAG